MKKVFSLLLVLVMVLSIAVPGMAAGKAKTKITLNKKGTVEVKLDETLQLFAAGRSGQISDVWLDLAGFLTGWIVVALIALFRRKRRI